MIENNINIQTHRPVNNINTNTGGIVDPSKIRNSPVHEIDPTRVGGVGKSDSENVQGQKTELFNRDSVHSQFIASLKTSPVLTETVRKLLTNKQLMNHIRSNPELSGMLMKFLGDVEITGEEEIKQLLEQQSQQFTKFNGEFFDVLRELISKSPGDDRLQQKLRNFLTSYDNYVSSESTFKSVLSTLDNIGRNLPKALEEHFEELKGMLDNTDMPKSLGVVKNQILPFIGRYIAKMNDFGAVKDYTSLLLHNIVRLETGSEDNLIRELNNLMEYARFISSYTDNDIERLENLLQQIISKESSENKGINSFINLIGKGLEETTDATTSGVMEDIMESLLMSQNTNINLQHLFVPINYNDNIMFSEIWVEFDEEYNKKTNTTEKSYKLFINFDVQNLGYFETIIKHTSHTTNIDIYVPKAISKNVDKIAKDLGELLNIKEYKNININISELDKSRRFDEVFTNIKERKRGIDVII